MKMMSWLAAAGLACALTSDGRADIVLYPAPGGVAASPRFAVQVNVGGVWTSSFVNFNAVRLPETNGVDNGAANHAGKSFSWTTFETAGAATVRVQRLSGSFGTCLVRPSRFNIAPANVGGNTVEFTVQPGQKVSVEFDTDIAPAYYNNAYPSVTNILMVFADRQRTVSATNGIPAADLYTVTPGTYQTIKGVPGATPPAAGQSTLGNAGVKKVVVFPPGVFDIGYWQVPNNIEQIHLCGGAVVYGAIDVLPQGYTSIVDIVTISNVYCQSAGTVPLRSSFKVTGPGILSGEKLPWHLKKDFTYSSGDIWWACVKELQLAVQTVTLEDVTLACSPHWVLTFMSDGGPRTAGTLDNFKIVGSWCYNNDGLPTPSGINSWIRNGFIHADDDALKLFSGYLSVSDCVLWQMDNGAAFQWGWFGKTVAGISVQDVDVIHFENWWGGASAGNRSLINFADNGKTDGGAISAMRFRNLRVEGNVLRLFGLAHSNQVIRDISFDTLMVGGTGVGYITTPPGRNYFNGKMSNWTFNNFAVGGTNITSLALATNVAQFDFFNGAGAGFVFTNNAPPPPFFLTWDANGATQTVTDGGGVWSAQSTNWWDGLATVAWPDGYNSAVLGAGSGTVGTLTVAGTVKVGDLTFATPGGGSYTVEGGTVDLGHVKRTITMANGLSPNYGYSCIGSALTGSGGLAVVGTLSGAATFGSILTLQGDNSGLAGPITIGSSGAGPTLVEVGHANGFGATGLANAVTVNGGGVYGNYVLVGSNIVVASKHLVLDTTLGVATLAYWQPGGSGTWDGNVALSGAGTAQFTAFVNGSTLAVGGGPDDTVTGAAGNLLVGDGGFFGTGGDVVLNSALSIGTTPVAKAGVGTWTIRSSNNVWGATAVNAGTLKLGAGGSLGDTAIRVAWGATFAVRPGNGGTVSAGSTGAGTAGASLAIPGGGVFDMTDGVPNTFNLRQQASFSGKGLSLTNATLRFDIGGSGADRLAVSRGAAVGGTNTLALTGLNSPLTRGQSYDLITAASGLTTGTPVPVWRFANGLQAMELVAGGMSCTVTLSATDTNIAVYVLPRGTLCLIR